MVAYCKIDIGTTNQTAFIMDGTKYIGNFTFTTDTLPQEIAKYCAKHGTLNEIILAGNENMLSQYKIDIEKQGILDYANNPIKVTIQGV